MTTGADGTLRVAMASYYLPSESKIGSGWMAHRLANALVDRGHAIVMFSPCSRPADAKYDHVRVELRGRSRVFQWAHRLRHLDLTSFDVFHAHGDDHWVRRAGAPVHVRTLHGSCFDEALHAHGPRARLRMSVLGLAELMTAARGAHIVGVSHASIRWFPWLHDVIPNGVDTECFRPDGAREPVPTILFVGTYERRKRGALLHQTFVDYVLPRVPGARLWMVCNDAPPGPGVEVLGRLSDAELADRYRRAWVFCLPSSYEGFGVPYIEAMASGTAVVASPNLGAREILAGGHYGVVCADDELGRGLVRLLVDDDERERQAERGLLGSRSFGWQGIASRYEDLYRELLQRSVP